MVPIYMCVYVCNRYAQTIYWDYCPLFILGKACFASIVSSMKFWCACMGVHFRSFRCSLVSQRSWTSATGVEYVSAVSDCIFIGRLRGGWSRLSTAWRRSQSVQGACVLQAGRRMAAVCESNSSKVVSLVSGDVSHTHCQSHTCNWLFTAERPLHDLYIERLSSTVGVHM